MTEKDDYVPFETMVIPSSEKSIIVEGKEENDKELNSLSLLDTLQKEASKHNTYQSRKDVNIFSLFDHDDEIMLLIKKSEINIKNIKSGYTDKMLKTLIEGFKILNLNEQQKRNPVMKYLKHSGI